MKTLFLDEKDFKKIKNSMIYSGKEDFYDFYGNVEIKGGLETVVFNKGLYVKGYIKAHDGTGINVKDKIKSGKKIDISLGIKTLLSIECVGDIIAGKEIRAGWGIDADGEIVAGDEIDAGWKIISYKGIKAGKEIKSEEIFSKGNIEAGWSIMSKYFIQANKKIIAGDEIFTKGEIIAGEDIISGGDIEAGGNIICGGNIIGKDSLNAGGNIKANLISVKGIILACVYSERGWINNKIICKKIKQGKITGGILIKS